MLPTNPRTLPSLRALLAQALADRAVWLRSGIPVAQKDLEIAGIQAQLARFGE
jgi:hypothetical protein